MSAEEELVDYEEDEEEVPAKETGRKGGAVKLKGRGHKGTKEGAAADKDRGGVYESLHSSTDTTAGPASSVEGYVICVTGVHQEATEDVVLDLFQEVGDVKNIQMNLDRRTGFVKGYALIEYETKEEAERAIKDLNGQDLLQQTLHVDWAFVNVKSSGRGGGGGRQRASR